MKLVFTATAEADLEEIGTYIAKDNPHRALTFVQKLRAAARAFSPMPRAAPLVPRYQRHGIRRHVFGKYLIFYRAEQNEVVIVRILHGARDYEGHLFPDD